MYFPPFYIFDVFFIFFPTIFTFMAHWALYTATVNLEDRGFFYAQQMQLLLRTY